MPIVFSTSPGATPLDQGEHIQNHANLWRISDDFWDDWRAWYAQFARLNDWTPCRGPGHWPDADMLPLGNVRTWQQRGAWTRFSRDEQYTLVTLWSIARSPLILGGNLPNNDAFTLSLLTNDEVLAVNQASLSNRQLFNRSNHIAWIADVPASKDKYLALFNASLQTEPAGRSEPSRISVSCAEIGLGDACSVRDLWAGKDLGTLEKTIAAQVNFHGAVLYRLSPVR